MEKVKEYMMKTLKSVRAEDTIGYVIKTMQKTEMTIFPVVNNKNAFQGTISSKNILKHIIPEEYGFMESHRVLYEINQAAENMVKVKNEKVSKYMSANAVTVKETDNMNNIANIMLSNDEQYLFVTNEYDKLRGYISRADLLYYLLHLSQNNE